MKKFLNRVKRALSILYKILPFFIGMYRYYPAFLKKGTLYPFLDALYASIKLYSGSTEAIVPMDASMQLARFLAMAATLSILVTALNRMNDVVNWLKRLQPNVPGATVVCGDSPCAGQVYSSLPARIRLRTEDGFLPGAARYVLMFSGDERNLDYYSRHYEDLKDKNVYIMLEDISRQSIENPRVSVFSIAENCARQYWRDYPPARSERVALVGFDSVGQNLLLTALQMNILDPRQHFSYHVYGDGTAFRRLHTRLEEMAPDEVVFHDGGVEDYARLADFDRIIICGGEGGRGAAAASRILTAAPVRCPVYLYAPNGDIITSLFGGERLICFGDTGETASADIIFNESSMAAARRQHEFYYRTYGGTPWEKLDAFKRYSNVSSSDYLQVIRRLMEQGVPMDTLAELEHIRWCRYHYLHNWSYAPETDAARRVHNCLVPFGELSEAEQRKDVEAIRSKLEE